ncbi:MAG: hypothetical protein JXQ23_02635 [Clostridia bacterium]|nr:hypothetical protein [Clostridia bacterium]
MIKKYNNEQAFTMVEIIIAIAALALICGFVLQIFILASKVNDRTVDKQFAINECANVVEVMNSLDSINQLYQDNYFENAEFKTEGNLIIINQLYDQYGVTVHTEIVLDHFTGYMVISAFKNDKMILGNELTASVIFKE